MDTIKKNTRKGQVEIIKSAIAELERHERELDELGDKFEELTDVFIDGTIDMGVNCRMAIEYLDEAWDILGWKPKDTGE